MNPQNQILEFAFQNTIPEFRERFSQNPNFVLTNIYDENHDCHIYLMKNRYRGQIAEYNFRIIRIVNDPFNPYVEEIQYYHNHNHNGRIVPNCPHRHKYRSEADVRKWTEVLNTYLRHNQQNQLQVQPQIEEDFEEAFEPDFEDEFDEEEIQDLFTLEYLDRYGGLETQIDDDQYEYDESLISNEILLEDDA